VLLPHTGSWTRLDHDLTNLAAVVASADAKPTTASVKYYEDLKGRLSAVFAESSRSRITTR
jgi:hypothetical protein